MSMEVIALILLQRIGSGNVGGSVGALWVNKSLGNLHGGPHAAGNAVRDAGTMVGGAGQMQSWMPCGDALNFSNARGVADIVLWIRLRPAIGPGQCRLRRDAHQDAQFLAGQIDQGVVALLRQGFRAGAANKDANQFKLVWRSVGKFL